MKSLFFNVFQLPNKITGMLLCCMLLANYTGYAQDPGARDSIPVGAKVMYHIETHDGNDYIGQIVREDANQVVFKAEALGEITLQRKMIRVMEPVPTDRYVEGEYWFRNPHDTRYFFAPNGYGLRKGEGYYQNTWVFFNQVSYGITNNISMGAGLVPLFLFNGAPTPVWITPKVSLPVVKNRLNLGVGAFAGTILSARNDLDYNMGFGIVYGTATVGPREHNFTVGAGYAYFDKQFVKQPAITFAGTTRIGKKMAFVTENYWLRADDESVGLLSAGMRFMGKRIAIDAALVTPVTSEIDFFALPWVSIHIPFGKNAQ